LSTTSSKSSLPKLLPKLKKSRLCEKKRKGSVRKRSAKRKKK